MTNQDNEYQLFKEVLGERFDLFQNENPNAKIVGEMKKPEEKNHEPFDNVEVDIVRPASPAPEENELPAKEEKLDHSDMILNELKEKLNFWQMPSHKDANSVTWTCNDRKGDSITFIIRVTELPLRYVLIIDKKYEYFLNKGFEKLIDVCTFFEQKWKRFVPQGGEVI